jgi:hypothetical protein
MLRSGGPWAWAGAGALTVGESTRGYSTGRERAEGEGTGWQDGSPSTALQQRSPSLSGELASRGEWPRRDWTQWASATVLSTWPGLWRLDRAAQQHWRRAEQSKVGLLKSGRPMAGSVAARCATLPFEEMPIQRCLGSPSSVPLVAV